MAQKLTRRSVEYVREYTRLFERTDGSGYSFPCDKDGKLENPEHEARIAECKADPQLFDMGIESWEKKVVVPGTLKCECGETIELWDPMTNRCDCGRFYNGSGQTLSHPRNWGEETGERFDDNGNYIDGGDY